MKETVNHLYNWKVWWIQIICCTKWRIKELHNKLPCSTLASGWRGDQFDGWLTTHFPRILSSWNFQFQYVSLASSWNTPANYINASSTFALGKQKHIILYIPETSRKYQTWYFHRCLLGLLLGNKTQRFSLRFVLLIQRFCWSTFVSAGILEESYQNNSKETNFIKQGIKYHHLQVGFVTTPSTKRFFSWCLFHHVEVRITQVPKVLNFGFLSFFGPQGRQYFMVSLPNGINAHSAPLWWVATLPVLVLVRL